MTKPTSFNKKQAYKLLYRARRSDEMLGEAVKQGHVPLPIHLSIGQEAVSVGACLALKPNDIVFGTYRGHALYIAKGGNLKKMFAELYGKATGSAKGKGGSMHLIDVGAGVMGMSAIVGTGIPNATGYALGMQYQKKRNVVVNFFGDGATEEGAFHESLNFAALKKLPIIYICENNKYAISTHQSIRQSELNIAVRAKSYGIRAKVIQGNDTLAIYQEVKKARDEILKNNSGPIFFECMTYRWRQHLGPNEDFGPGGRDIREAECWIKNDELIRIGKLLPIKTKQKIELVVESEIKKAILFAEKSPYPAKRDLWTDVFAP
ncbi:MAG: thiamine pyrophosphate-dependent dehydrogenase E1 component subunit alpha [Patescibacteria group bacterium]